MKSEVFMKDIKMAIKVPQKQSLKLFRKSVLSFFFSFLKCV